MTDAELDAAIADLEGMLAARVSRTTADGVSQDFDLAGAEVQLLSLKRRRRKRQGRAVRHPYASPTFGGSA